MMRHGEREIKTGHEGRSRIQNCYKFRIDFNLGLVFGDLGITVTVTILHAQISELERGGEFEPQLEAPDAFDHSALRANFKIL